MVVEAVTAFEVVKGVGVSEVGNRGMLVLEAHGGLSGTDCVEGGGTGLLGSVRGRRSKVAVAGWGDDERRVGVDSRLVE